MVVEFGAREAELGRQPRRYLKFFSDYQDRILFGTDSEPEDAMYANYFRWLETRDEYFPYWGYPGQGRWEIYGIGAAGLLFSKRFITRTQKTFCAIQRTRTDMSNRLLSSALILRSSQSRFRRGANKNLGDSCYSGLPEGHRLPEAAGSKPVNARRRRKIRYRGTHLGRGAVTIRTPATNSCSAHRARSRLP